MSVNCYGFISAFERRQQTFALSGTNKLGGHVFEKDGVWPTQLGAFAVA